MHIIYTYTYSHDMYIYIIPTYTLIKIKCFEVVYYVAFRKLSFYPPERYLIHRKIEKQKSQIVYCFFLVWTLFVLVVVMLLFFFSLKMFYYYYDNFNLVNPLMVSILLFKLFELQ